MRVIGRSGALGRVAALALGALPLGGCGPLLDLLSPQNTTVLLVNNGDFPVFVQVVYSSEQDTPEDLLDDVGTRLEYTIPAGQSASFSRDCDDLQVVQIENAELRVVGAIGPTTSSRAYRDGSDFNCRDTVTFTFDHSGLLVDFSVTFAR